MQCSGGTWESHGREHPQTALVPLCRHLLGSLVSPLGQPGTGGSRFLPKPALKPCGCMDAHPSCGWPPSHAVPFLPGPQPLSFRTCSYRGLDTKTQLSHLSHVQNQQEPWHNVPVPPGPTGTWGTSNLPALWCWQGLSARPQEVLNGDLPSTAAPLHQETPPQPGVGTNQHQPAPGCPSTFLPAALGGCSALSASGSSHSAAPLLHSLPWGQSLPCRIFTLSVFSF